ERAAEFGGDLPMTQCAARFSRYTRPWEVSRSCDLGGLFPHGSLAESRSGTYISPTQEGGSRSRCQHANLYHKRRTGQLTALPVAGESSEPAARQSLYPDLVHR